MVLGLLLHIATAATPEPVGIAITPLQLVDVSPELGGYAEDRLANHLGDLGFKVTTPADIAALLGIERQRQLLGCSEDGCNAEIGSALGVPLMLVGRVTKLEERFDIDLRVIRQRDGLVVARDTRRIVGIKGLGELMEAAGDSLAKQLAPKTPFAWRLWVPVLAGTVAAGVGGVLWAQAELQHASYTGAGSLPVTRILGLKNIDAKFAQLSTQRLIGMVVAGAGVVLIAGGFVWNALVPSLPVSVVVAPQAGGATFALGGTF
ncbi:MAG: hypothetical protein GQE15_06905 [Archangiaceae bacterium]|nr:hypothetical protein [Archangiaceae bacterium]